jgi:tRNA pseudouridine38-40 synthase
MPQEKKYKLVIAYDGTSYCGWQEQPALKSVSGAIRTAFKRLFKKEVYLLGASRTDAGVHALGQVALLKSDLIIDPFSLAQALNNILPANIVVRSATQVAKDFHPWYQVTQKIYYYHFFLKRPLPFLAAYGWYFRYALDLEKLQQSLSVFAGTHNFRSFACAQDGRENMVRTIDYIAVTYIKKYGMYRIEVRGQKFLRHMIRRMVGAALHIAANKQKSIEYIRDTLKAEDPHHILPNAPANGLVLRRIYYL